MTLLLRRKRQITPANPTLSAWLINSLKLGADPVQRRLEKRSLSTWNILFLLTAIMFPLPSAVCGQQASRAPRFNDGERASQIASAYDENEYRPPVHAKPIHNANGERTTIRSRVFPTQATDAQVPMTNQSEHSQQVPRIANSLPDAHAISTQHQANSVDDQIHRRSTGVNSSRVENPLRQSTHTQQHQRNPRQNYEVQQVGYNQDYLEWGQQRRSANSPQQTNYNSMQLQAPRQQDDWKPASNQYEDSVQPLHDPFGDNSRYRSTTPNVDQRMVPRRRESTGQPTLADPRTNPNYGRND
ncbi:MAG TPA: hypothetical protein PKA83_09270, partial [Pirellulaceae bacterium]|nr:hypothetical protein [Pirellulaceae bacterium]